MIRRCPEHGVSVIHLEVRESGAPARHLYEKTGFTVDGIRKGYYTMPTEDAVLMTLRLPGAPET
jgi:ribosomal-protein-alanine N-acetyltransferase